MLLLGAATAFAQQAAPQAEPPQAPPAEAAAPAAPPDRIGRLEQQIAVLQAMVAALESLVKAKPDVTLPQENTGGNALDLRAGQKISRLNPSRRPRSLPPARL